MSLHSGPDCSSYLREKEWKVNERKRGGEEEEEEEKREEREREGAERELHRSGGLR